MYKETVNETVEETTEETAAETTEGEVSVKRARKLEKDIEGSVVKISAIGGELGEMLFDAKSLPAEIQELLVPFGLSHKLGDAAAGKTGSEAEEAIKKVFDSLMNGEFVQKKASTPKVSVNTIKDNLAKMSPKEAERARALMAQMGIVI